MWNRHNGKSNGSLLVVLAAVLWGTMGFWVRSLNEAGFGAMDILAVRAVGSFLLLGIFFLFSYKKWFGIKVRDLWCFAGTGILSLVFFNYCYFTTINMTSLSVAAILLYTAPVFVLLLSAFIWKEKLDRRKIVALLCAFLGCVLVTGALGDVKNVTIAGVWFGLGSGLGYALYTIFGQIALNKGYHSLTISFYTFLFAAIGAMPFCNIKHMAAAIRRNPAVWIYMTGLALFVTVIAYGAYTVGLSYMEPGRASIIACMEPVVAAGIGIFLYKEELTASTFLGILLVLSSTVLVRKKI